MLTVGMVVVTGAAVSGLTGSSVRVDTGAPLLTIGIAVVTGATVTGPTGYLVRGDTDVGSGEGISNEGAAMGLNVSTGAREVGFVFETGDSLAGGTEG